jgi:hypothetical protein
MLRGQKRTNTRTTILALIQARGASIFFSHTQKQRGEQTIRNQKIQRLDGTKNMISAPPVCEREQNLGEPKRARERENIKAEWVVAN